MNETFVTYSKKLSVKKEYDVIVCGGGVAGVAAAVSAAKNGCSVLLLEKSNILGGLGTLGLINLFVRADLMICTGPAGFPAGPVLFQSREIGNRNAVFFISWF